MTTTQGEQIVVRNSNDIIAIIDSGRLTPKRAKLIMVVALGSIFVDGWDLGSFGLGTVQISSTFDLGTGNFGFHSLPFISASVLVGALLGGLIGGWLTDRVGRLRMFLIDLALLVVATIACALAPNVYLFVLFRFLIGVGVGLDVPVALAFIAEFSAIAAKGRNVNIAQVMSTGAAAVVFLSVIPLQLLGVGDSLWRWAIGFGAIPALIVLGLRFAYAAESPMWAARHQSVERAVEILETNYHLDADIVVAPEAHTAERSPHTRFRDLAQLFTPRYRTRTLFVMILVLGQAIEYYAISLYTPTILNDLFGPDHIIKILLLSALANAVGAVGAYLCARLTQRLGLRGIAAIGYLGTATCLIVVSSLYNVLAAGVASAVIIAFYFAHNLGPGYAGSAMGTLSYPTEIRGISGGYAQAVTRVGGMLGAYLFPVLTNAHGPRFTIGAITVVPILALIAIGLIKWDPVNKDVEIADPHLARDAVTA